ncbi:hypothetical protein KP509_30G030100 [Ceratopteris richardii]|uniref:Uncharacterized protein n=2 Tax=Ceratopteris richardii TaxID=49495 RepID=A0A8T2R362_CERRI|nr:hypothetical protein KP509_30G030100 [Ceratopteris richardii]
MEEMNLVVCITGPVLYSGTEQMTGTSSHNLREMKLFDLISSPGAF